MKRTKLVRQWRDQAKSFRTLADAHVQGDTPEEALWYLGQAVAYDQVATSLEFVEAMEGIRAKR
jgi:hypothetical protein